MKLTGINIIRLDDMIEALGEDIVLNEHLLLFCCPSNPDIEYFLREKAIEFSRREWAKTHLVYVSYQGNPALVGYFALTASKPVLIDTSTLSRDYRNRIRNFIREDIHNKKCYINMPLIAQLSKNYCNGYDKLISGAQLLQLAIDELRKVQVVMGGQFVYVECEDEKWLVDFYKQNGFKEFGYRDRDRDEQKIKSPQLCQLLRRIK